MLCRQWAREFGRLTPRRRVVAAAVALAVPLALTPGTAQATTGFVAAATANNGSGAKRCR